jgi:hypothetical protein
MSYFGTFPSLDRFTAMNFGGLRRHKTTRRWHFRPADNAGAITGRILNAAVG